MRPCAEASHLSNAHLHAPDTHVRRSLRGVAASQHHPHNSTSACSSLAWRTPGLPICLSWMHFFAMPQAEMSTRRFPQPSSCLRPLSLTAAPPSLMVKPSLHFV